MFLCGRTMSNTIFRRQYIEKREIFIHEKRTITIIFLLAQQVPCRGIFRGKALLTRSFMNNQPGKEMSSNYKNVFTVDIQNHSFHVRPFDFLPREIKIIMYTANVGEKCMRRKKTFAECYYAVNYSIFDLGEACWIKSNTQVLHKLITS